MKNIIISIIWDELTERFKEADDISIEDVNHDTVKYLTLFLAEGYDATTIAQMMERHDVFKYYPILKEHGATMINLPEMFSDDPDFVSKNFDTFINYGIPADDVIKALVSEDRFIDEADLEHYIKKGATPRLILKIFEKEDKFYEFGCDAVYRLLEKLIVQGCDKKIVTSWLKSSETGKRWEIVDDIVEYRTEKWSNVVFPEQFIDRWIAYNAEDYIDGTYSLKSLPKLVSYDTIIDHFSMAEIITMTSGRMYEFIDDYRNVGGDPNKLAERFKKEIGKPKSTFEKAALRDMEDQNLIVIPNDGSSQA